jgi:hypothetical protein
MKDWDKKIKEINGNTIYVDLESGFPTALQKEIRDGLTANGWHLVPNADGADNTIRIIATYRAFNPIGRQNDTKVISLSQALGENYDASDKSVDAISAGVPRVSLPGSPDLGADYSGSIMEGLMQGGSSIPFAGLIGQLASTVINAGSNAVTHASDPGDPQRIIFNQITQPVNGQRMTPSQLHEQVYPNLYNEGLLYYIEASGKTIMFKHTYAVDGERVIYPGTGDVPSFVNAVTDELIASFGVVHGSAPTAASAQDTSAQKQEAVK